ncbi:glycogen synthase [Thermococcus kodakarensis KOD1]|uniref:Glycogen synthase n=1 Tax=Thermococcus kodakarensis (strain ATCC BAA-918 / JCM 12380 / KOD1) TaxID=69014 RepID=Q5JJ61_THEKO|nr:glycogen synthase [Thermococcus kodakarensis]WCN27680.1 glycogen synthase [Thermococcus kodakarensis]WCN29972.1 glycogen synthase [Thermococcus kodakarensis]BAD85957.1 glycogen synthase [Thermococcus kodakarensis KOD1]
MRILMLGFEYLPVKVGGLAEALTSIGEGLAGLGNEVVVFTPDHGRKLGEELASFRVLLEGREVEVKVRKREQNGVIVYSLGGSYLDLDVYPGWEDLLKKAVLFGKASAGLMNILIGEFKPDVVHAHDWHTVFALGLLKKYFGVRAVFTVHRLNRAKVPASYFHEANLGELAPFPDLDPEHTAGYIADAVTTVSRSYLWEEWSFFKNFDGKVTHVFNGIDCSYWNEEFLEGKDLPREERRKRILQRFGLSDGKAFMFIGRFDRAQKGVDTLLRAIELLSTDPAFKSLRFLIVGKGDPGLESWARETERRFPENVKVITELLSRETVRELYGSVDFVVIPSYFEPFGLVQLEAMCLGAIPIGSAVGGIKDTVIDLDADPERATGLLVPPRDAFALARTIIRASELDEETLKRLRENGKRRAREDFTWEKACRRYLRVYQNAVDKAIPFLR